MATIKDVARLAGVGTGTVSRALSGKGSVSADTRRKIEAAISSLSYRPSSIAQSLSNRKSGIIGVLLPHFGAGFYEKVLSVIEAELRAYGKYFVVATSASADDDSFDFLLSRDCDGILLFVSDARDRQIRALERKFETIAVVNRIVPGLEEKCFAADHVAGGRIAARALIESGRTRFAMISGPALRDDSLLRRKGFTEELAASGLSLADELVVEGDFRNEGGWAGCQALLARGLPFDALFCANDAMATGAMGCLAEAGLSVPGDVAVIGYDNLPYTRYLVPPLSTVDGEISETVRNAARHLLQHCYGVETENTHVLTPHFIARASHGAP